MGAIVLSSRWWETTKGGGADVGAIVGGGLGGDGVGMSAESRSRMMSSLAVISRVLVVISKVWVVMEDNFRVRWYTTSSRRSRVVWWL